MTPEEAKAYNEAHIRIKTADLSILTDEVADAIDNVIDMIPIEGAAAVAFFGADQQITADQANLFWVNLNKRLVVKGEVRITGAAGSTDSGYYFATPVDAGYSRGMQFDQVNCRMRFMNMNGDYESGLWRVAKHSPEFRVISGDVKDSFNNNQIGILTFHAGSAGEKMRLTSVGFAAAFRSKDGPPVAGDIPAGFFAVYKDNLTGAFTLYCNNGGTITPVMSTRPRERVRKDIDILAACLSATIDADNGFEAVIHPAHNKVLLKGQVVKGTHHLFFAIEDNIITRMPLG